IAAEGTAESGEQPRSMGTILIRGDNGLLEQGQELGIGAGAGEGEPPSVAKRRAGQPLAVAELPRPLGSLEERLVRRLKLAHSAARFADPEQEVAAHCLIRHRRQLKRLEAQRIATSSLLTGEH